MKQGFMVAILVLTTTVSYGQLVISGNENKIDLSGGSAQVIADAEPDSISILDFGQLPPSVRHIHGINNTVIGPPSNIAITPDGRYIIVQCHPEKRLWLFEIDGENVRDTGERITTPGFPSSLRAADKPLKP